MEHRQADMLCVHRAHSAAEQNHHNKSSRCPSGSAPQVQGIGSEAGCQLAARAHLMQANVAAQTSRTSVAGAPDHQRPLPASPELIWTDASPAPYQQFPPPHPPACPDTSHHRLSKDLLTWARANRSPSRLELPDMTSRFLMLVRAATLSAICSNYATRNTCRRHYVDDDQCHTRSILFLQPPCLPSAAHVCRTKTWW
jgi:hypothetical protein